jgi:hypothetical protein
MEDRAMLFWARALPIFLALAFLAPSGAAAGTLGAVGAAAMPAPAAAVQSRAKYRCTRAYHHCRFNTEDKQRCEAVRRFCTEGGRKKK